MFNILRIDKNKHLSLLVTASRQRLWIVQNLLITIRHTAELRTTYSYVLAHYALFINVDVDVDVKIKILFNYSSLWITTFLNIVAYLQGDRKINVAIRNILENVQS